MLMLLLACLPLVLCFSNPPSTPRLPPPPPPKPPELDLEELARKRRDLQNRRRGAGSLRIDTAVATGADQTGLRIPNA